MKVQSTFLSLHIPASGDHAGISKDPRKMNFATPLSWYHGIGLLGIKFLCRALNVEAERRLCWGQGDSTFLSKLVGNNRSESRIVQLDYADCISKMLFTQ